MKPTSTICPVNSSKKSNKSLVITKAGKRKEKQKHGKEFERIVGEEERFLVSCNKTISKLLGAYIYFSSQYFGIVLVYLILNISAGDFRSFIGSLQHMYFTIVCS